MELFFSILLVVIGLSAGVAGSFLVNNMKEKNSSKKAEEIIEKAKKEAEKAKRDSLLEAKEEMHKLKIETDNEIQERKNELKISEDRLIQRENNMDKREELYQKRDMALDDRENSLLAKQEEIQNERAKVEELKQEQLDLLSTISGLSKDKAHALMMKKVEEQMNKEIAVYIKERENEAKLIADKKSKDLIVL